MGSQESRPDPGRFLEGVVFSDEHQAGFWRRVVASLVDFLVLYGLYVALFNVWLILAGSPGFNAFTFILAVTLGAAVYVAPLKRSWLRTVGYRVAGVRIVDLRGRQPSLLMLLLRGAINLVATGVVWIDFAWFLGQRPRQKLTDLLTGTYVVRTHAKPIAQSAIVPVYYALAGHFWVVHEVRKPSGIPVLND